MFNQLDFVHSCTKWLERVILNETPEAPLHRCYYAKGVLKICSKFTGKHPCRSVSNFTEIALQHGCSTVNLLHTFRVPYPKNTSEGILLKHKFKTLSK